MPDKCCGMCKYNRFREDDFVCDNPVSKYYSDFNEYGFCFEEWEGKE